MAGSRYYLNALGITSCLGNSVEKIRDNLQHRTSTFFTPWKGRGTSNGTLVGAIHSELPAVPETLQLFNTRNNQLVLSALNQLAAPLKDLFERVSRDRIGVVVGSSTSGVSEGEQAIIARKEAGQFPEGFDLSMQELGSTAEFIASYLEVTGPAYTISTACSSSAKAFLSARNLLTLNMCDAVIVGGADSLCELTIQGFSSLEAVSSGVCNPMSKNRDGINIGEGAAFFIMEREGAGVYFAGGGASSDAYHMSAPHPDGIGAEASMQAALADAGLASTDIVYINMHGTATLLNDAMESRAIHRVFGDTVPCSSSKPLTGHTLGAAGAVEAALCWIFLNDENEQTKPPPHHWDGVSDENLPRLNLVDLNGSSYTNRGAAVLSNSFAFGGSNCSLVFKKDD